MTNLNLLLPYSKCLARDSSRYPFLPGEGGDVAQEGRRARVRAFGTASAKSIELLIPFT
jgi:hypothetical protein